VIESIALEAILNCCSRSVMPCRRSIHVKSVYAVNAKHATDTNLMLRAYMVLLLIYGSRRRSASTVKLPRRSPPARAATAIGLRAPGQGSSSETSVYRHRKHGDTVHSRRKGYSPDNICSDEQLEAEQNRASEVLAVALIPLKAIVGWRVGTAHTGDHEPADDKPPAVSVALQCSARYDKVSAKAVDMSALRDAQYGKRREIGSGITEEQVRRDVLLLSQPTKKFVTVEQVAALVRFLCSTDADSITGAVLPIEGGWTAHWPCM
jgi:hypothetical protein